MYIFFKKDEMVYVLRDLDGGMSGLRDMVDIDDSYKKGKFVLNGWTYWGGSGVRVMATSKNKMPRLDNMKVRGGVMKVILEYGLPEWENMCDFEKSLNGSLLLEMVCYDDSTNRWEYASICKVYSSCKSGHNLWIDDVHLGTGGLLEIHQVKDKVILVWSLKME